MNPQSTSLQAASPRSPAARSAHSQATAPLRPGPVQFLWRGQAVVLDDVPPTLTVLDWLREHRHATGTKEGCAEGDCGACTVVLAELDEAAAAPAVPGAAASATGTPAAGSPRLRWRAINSCIRFVASLDGCALFTVEDLRAPDGSLHPVQQALVEHHGSQCGFCTPGFAMSLFALYNEAMAEGRGEAVGDGTDNDGTDNDGDGTGTGTGSDGGTTVGSGSGNAPAGAPGLRATPVSRERAKVALSGNLCRCTGYRPILDAAEAMTALPARPVDEAKLAAQLTKLRGARAADDGRRGDSVEGAGVRDESAEGAGAQVEPAGGTSGQDEWAEAAGLRIGSTEGVTLRPATLQALLAARRDAPDAQVIAGCTDVGLWVTKQHRRFATVLDLTGVAELRRIDAGADGGLAIGAAATLEDAYARLVTAWPELATFAERFASRPVRNSGTLGGNVANGSPIGDSMPLLIALGAEVELARMEGAPGSGPGPIRRRRLPIEDFYLGYRRTALGPDELLVAVHVPALAAGSGAAASAGTTPSTQPTAAGPAGAPPTDGELLRAYKISKRFDQDISAVCLGIRVRLAQGRVAEARIGVGGMAAVPARARDTEAALIGAPWTEDTIAAAAARLRAEFSPIDDMRAPAAYRREVAGALLERFWHESRGVAANLERGLR